MKLSQTLGKSLWAFLFNSGSCNGCEIETVATVTPRYDLERFGIKVVGSPRHADILMGLTNTAGTVPGIVGIAITGWLVDVSGTYTTAFALAAAVNLVGAFVWLFFGTARRVID